MQYSLPPTTVSLSTAIDIYFDKVSPTVAIPKLRAYLERNFAQFVPIRYATDYGAFKKLTIMLANAARLVYYNIDDAELHSMVRIFFFLLL